VEQEPKNERTEKGRFAPGNSGRKRKREIRADGLVNAFTGHGTPRDRRSASYHVTCAVTDLAGIDMRRGNWLARRICELLPADCFRKGYTLKLDDKDTAEKVMAIAESLGVNQRLVEAGQMERAAGGAALYPVLDGALGDASQPLDFAQPRIAKLNAIHLLEPRELIPATWYTDLNNPKFRMPETYRLHPLSSGSGASWLSQVLIHESRLVIFPGRRVTAEPMPGQRWGWGDNELTTVDEAIKDFGLSWGSAATILQNFSQRVFKFKGLMDILKETGGEALVQKRAQVMDMLANTLRAMPLDGEDDLINITTSVGGLADLLVQLAQLVSAAADIPMTRLFGMSPAGMNATGEFDQDGWHERVGNEQTHKYTCLAERLLRLIMLSTAGPTGGKEPDVWSIEWLPLKNQSAKDIAETRKLIAETDQINIGEGVYTADDAAESHYRGDTYGTDITIDWKRREEQKKIDEVRAEDLKAAELAAMGRGPTNPAPPDPTKPPPGAGA
jgi:phage-related protein (TIGR01555 family)